MIAAAEVDNSFVPKESSSMINLVKTIVDPEKKRELINHLSLVLTNTYILALKTFSYTSKLHEKINAELFAALKDQYDDMVYAVHQLSSSIRDLGYEIPDSLSHVRKFSEIIEENDSDSALLAELVRNNEKVVQLIKNGLQNTSDAGDDSTTHLLKKRMKKHESHAWLIKSAFLR